MTEKASLKGPLLKLDRAEAHLEVLYAKRNVFVAAEDNSYAITDDLESEVKTEGSRRVTYVASIHIRRVPDAEWGLIVGDFAHNLRSALDHLVWQLVILSGAKPERGQPVPDQHDGHALLAQPKGRHAKHQGPNA